MENFFNLRNEGGRLRADGASVKRARIAAGLTQAVLASRMRLLGYYLPQPSVSLLERGLCRLGLTERMAAALAAALGVGLSDIVGGRVLTTADIHRFQGLVSQLDDVVVP